ncbi:hypothetical protein [Kutzneria sp. NPDC052558]|uniref:hypothetical protein n=1 Tax=Kutzneria sp. NPDC052558 TaxID=3364121 RepID=UPI0037CC7D74
MAPVTAILPATPPQVLADGLAATSARFASHGLTIVRDPAVTPEEWRAYAGIAADGRLAIRNLPMIFTPW